MLTVRKVDDDNNQDTNSLRLQIYFFRIEFYEIHEHQIVDEKDVLAQIVSMLVGLIKSNSSDRLYEEPPPYGKMGK